MKFIKKWATNLAVAALSVASFQVSAQTLPATEFQDQHEASILLNEQTKWVLLTSEKAAGKLVKETLNAMGMTDLSAKAGLYVADVSAMPGFITRMVALPKMKDYAFKVAVVMEEEQVAGWPREEDQVTAMTLNNLNVESVEYIDSQEALQAWIQKQM